MQVSILVTEEVSFIQNFQRQLNNAKQTFPSFPQHNQKSSLEDLLGKVIQRNDTKDRSIYGKSGQKLSESLGINKKFRKINKLVG